VRVLFSRLVQEQLHDLPVAGRRKLLKAIRVQLTAFPESGIPLDEQVAPGYRQVVSGATVMSLDSSAR